MKRVLSPVIIALALVGGLSQADTSFAKDKAVSVHLGAAADFPLSDSRQSFKDGWGLAGGLTWHASERFGLEFDYSYNRHGLKGDVFQLTSLGGSHSVQNLDLNAVLYTAGSDDSSLYLLGGGGAYRRNVEITNFEGYAGGIVCNPWWFVCFPATVPVESVLGSRSAWDLGLDVGVGYQFKMRGDTSFWIETRYHHIFGGRVEAGAAQPVQGRDEKATGQYIQVRAGFRF